jgi:hypothetical protein
MLCVRFLISLTWPNCRANLYHSDNAYGRILSYGTPASNTNTVTSCINACQAAGFTLAGMEFGQECYCGKALTNGAAKANADTECNV